MKKDPMLFFVSGSSGVGKSSTIKHLKDLLPEGDYDIRDFDERGVTTGGGPKWHDEETLSWLKIAKDNANKNKSTIVCGFQNPERLSELHNKEKDAPVKIILLHASPDTIRNRLLERHNTTESIKEIERASGVSLEKFIENMLSYLPTLRGVFEERNLPIIETDNKTPEEVAKEIIKYL